MRSLVFSISCVLAAVGPAGAQTVNFEDLASSLGTPPSQAYAQPTGGTGYYYNGSDGAGSFTSGGATFNNVYDSSFGSWTGWSSSNVFDTTTAGFGNQYAAYTAGGSSGAAGAGGSGTYAVAFQSFDYVSPFPPIVTPTIELPTGMRPESISIANTTYTAMTIRDGDGFGFAQPFTDGSYFKLTISGQDSGGASTGSVDFYLADYRYDAGTSTYKHDIVGDWTMVSLAGLGANTTSLSFNLASSDVGSFGINTPTYFAADNLQLAPTPEPVTTGLIAAGGFGAFAAWRRRKRAAVAA